LKRITWIVVYISLVVTTTTAGEILARRVIKYGKLHYMFAAMAFCQLFHSCSSHWSHYNWLSFYRLFKRNYWSWYVQGEFTADESANSFHSCFNASHTHEQDMMSIGLIALSLSCLLQIFHGLQKLLHFEVGSSPLLSSLYCQVHNTHAITL